MAVKTETKHAGEFLLHEGMRDMSREKVTVLSGQNLGVGAVVGRVGLGIGGMVAVLSGSSPGDGTMTAIFAGPDVEEGAYLVQCTAIATNNGTFSVTAPSGKVLPPAVMAGGTLVYTSSHINFTLTDGSADFALTALFTVTVGATAPVVIGGTGTGVMTALSLGPDALPGQYRVQNKVVVTNGGDMEVINPLGESIGRFIWAASGSTAAFTSRQVNFTLSDATDYIAANYFDIAVYNKGERGKGKVVAYDPKTYDGRHRVAGILFDAVDASASDLPGLIIARHAMVKSGDLAWAAAVVSAQQQVAKTEMAQLLDIVVRDNY